MYIYIYITCLDSPRSFFSSGKDVQIQEAVPGIKPIRSMAWGSPKMPPPMMVLERLKILKSLAGRCWQSDCLKEELLGNDGKMMERYGKCENSQWISETTKRHEVSKIQQRSRFPIENPESYQVHDACVSRAPTCTNRWNSMDPKPVWFW